MDLNLPSAKEMLVLELLAGNAKMYGLQMVEASPGLKRGAIYVMLDRLETKGFIKSEKQSGVAQQTKSSRLVYSITGLGQRAYRARLAAETELFGGEALV